MNQRIIAPGLKASRWLHAFALVTALATLALIIIGGLVTSHEAGMAVPDWPNTYGYNMFAFPFSKWVGGILYEHSHRLIASFVGLLTSVLALWLWIRETRSRERWLGIVGIFFVLGLMGARILPVYVVLACGALLAMVLGFIKQRQNPGTLRWLGIMALAAVILQGVLGGLRVVWLKDQIGIFHATLAQLFFCLLCGIAFLTSQWWAPEPASASKPNWFLPVITLLLLCQLILGATMRHQHAGLAIPDFPLAYGKIWPAMDPASVAQYNQQRLEVVAVKPITSLQIGLQLAHRMLALLICVAVTVYAWSTQRSLGSRHPLTWLSRFWLVIILVQALLGAATIWSNKAADIATAHVLTGALALATGFISIMVAFGGRVLAPVQRPEAFSGSPTLAARPSAA